MISLNINWGNGLLPDGTKSLPESVFTYYQLNPQEHISMKFCFYSQTLSFMQMHIYSWSQQNINHFIQASMSWHPRCSHFGTFYWCHSSGGVVIPFDAHSQYPIYWFQQKKHATAVSLSAAKVSMALMTPMTNLHWSLWEGPKQSVVAGSDLDRYS